MPDIVKNCMQYLAPRAKSSSRHQGVNQSLKSKQSANRWLTLLQVLVGLAVLAGVLWIASRLYGYYRARADYDRISAGYTAPVAVQDAGTGQGTPASAGRMTVDFAALQAQYPDVVGWLQMDDCPAIDYPVLQAQDNDYYLRRAPDGSHSEAGSLFVDCANQSLADPYVLIYGHHMQDGSMFAGLLDYQDEAFYRDGTGCFTLYTPEGVRRYQIFAVQFADDSSPLYSIGFAHDAAFDTFLQQVKAGSLYDTGVSVSAEDQVLSLSTCATVSGEGKLIVTAKYIGGE